MPLERRRKYFIDKKLQGVWGLLNLFLILIIAGFIGIELMRSSLVEFGWPLAGKPFNLPDLLFIIKLVIMVAIGSGFFWLLSAFAGHRIAGPIYRLEQSLKEVIKGNYGLRIQFRKKDFFQDIAETFNEMNQSIEQKIKEKDDVIERVKEKIKALPQDNPQVQELKKMLGA
jgi:methyl-accepting chemotaxis protein